jgi:raffinose/stachyose/melibiose transport system substrate-binding protein
LRAVAAAERPDIQIEFMSQPVDIYETIGLPVLLAGERPPDVMYEWAGERIAVLRRFGFAADLTGQLGEGDWSRFLPLAWTGTTIEGRRYMLPWSIEIADVVWYSKSMFVAHGVSEPKNWDEFLAVCEKFRRAGVLPICIGNKEQWPAGNWMGHLISRIIGEPPYTAALRGERPFYAPDFRQAFKAVELLRSRGYINQDLNDLTAEQAFAQWSHGASAMHPNGSWVVSIVQAGEIGQDADFFNLPPVAGGRGDQSSVTGDTTGFVVNGRTRHLPEAMYVLRLLTSPAIMKMFAEEGRNTAVPVATSQPQPVSAKMRRLVSTASVMLPPPDVGFELERADAFNMAVAQILGGLASGDEALRALDERLAEKRPGAARRLPLGGSK